MFFLLICKGHWFCCISKGSAVSHTNDHHKTEVQVVWIAPEAPPSSVRFLYVSQNISFIMHLHDAKRLWVLFGFRVTVLRRYSEFWVKIPGPVVSQYGVSPPPAGTTIDGSSDAKTAITSSMLSRAVSCADAFFPKWLILHMHTYLLTSNHFFFLVHLWWMWKQQVLSERSRWLWPPKWHVVSLPVLQERGN